ncbi:AMP-binding protein [Streptomyces goshikiensis]|uniref:AMP-binding protein n=1 Tax=Streptomyces goshikiensis TaxID=1942 RepID=UPI003700859E
MNSAEHRDLIHMLDASARAHADVVALDTNGDDLTYGQLWAWVGSVRSLLPAGEARIGVLAPRSPQACVAYLAALTSASAVVPMNPAFPVERNLMIASLSGIRWVLAPSSLGHELTEAFESAGIHVVPVHDRPRAEGLPLEPVRAVSPDQDAYVLFTSGSTGTPKGVPIRHDSATVYVRHVVERYGLGPGCRVSHNFDLTFDPSVIDLIASLCSGATVVIPGEREALLATAYVRDRRITHWFSVPSMISRARQLRLLKPCSMPGLRWSVFIGEPFTLEQAAAWAEAAPHSRIENIYGPTELTVSCTSHLLPADRDDWPDSGNGTVPIGLPYPHVEILVVDADGAASEEGELCVRGIQRFGGYLDPAENSGRFHCPGPERVHAYNGTGPLTDEHWYRTGDRVRWVDGELVHLGRLDRQVKLRGFRMELGDIEAAIRRLPGVEDAAVVVVRGQGEPALVGFHTGEADKSARAELAAMLPAYMVPQRLSGLAQLPLNANGKTDYLKVTDLASALCAPRSAALRP